MKIGGRHYRTIWVKPEDDRVIQIIDQRWLPHKFVVEDLMSVDNFCAAIKELHVRGAGLIGATAGYGMYVAVLDAIERGVSGVNEFLKEAGDKMIATRPTAVNLSWAVNRQLEEIGKVDGINAKKEVAFRVAKEIADEDAEFCRRIGVHGVKIIEDIAKRKNGEVVNILTHCNAGWLAFVDYGSATAPIYEAIKRGIKVHVWVDETRPHNKGDRLTAYELLHEKVPHTVIVDNVGGHLMQHGMVDLVLVGSDRTTYTGFVGNQIGTYLKALAAKDNSVPFYVALPSSTFDWKIRDGIKEIPIEKRNGDDTKYVYGLVDGEIKDVLLTPKESPAATYVFDVTPPGLVTGLITERGICNASEEGVLGLFPEKRACLKNNFLYVN